MLMIAMGVGFLAATACSQGEERPPTAKATSTDSVTKSAPVVDHSKMAGMNMDTSMKTGAASQSETSMAGMDHSSMNAPSAGSTAAQRSMDPNMKMGGAQKTTAMDHSGMQMSGSKSAGSGAMDPNMKIGSGNAGKAMAGLDHSNMKMPGTRPMDPNMKMGADQSANSMAGMDHSTMTATQAVPNPGVTAVDHSKMNMSTSNSSATGMAGMNMQSPPGAASSAGRQGMSVMPSMKIDDVGMEKLRMLVSELVRDPKVLERIKADPLLARAWESPAVRQYLLKRP